jgi:hypothetical protein
MYFYINMYRIWIHRPSAADIFVKITIDEAINFTRHVLSVHSPDNYNLDHLDIDSLLINGRLYLGDSTSLQISIILENYVPTEGWEFWNHRGFINATPEEALSLGTECEPEGFIAGESSLPWVKETRTHMELDQELMNYMNQPTELSHEQKSFLKMVYAMFAT